MTTTTITTSSRRPRAAMPFIALALTLLAGAPTASAQDALGSGQALDANPLVGSGGRNLPNARSAFARELQLRNAIVTGNAPDGRSFRGDVGYTASDDFRGDLGSNDLFDFNRDSIFSTLATRDVRGIQALRFNLGQSIANQTDNLLGAGLIVDRSQSGSSPSRQGLAPGTTTIEIDPFGHLQGAIRSTTEFQIANSRFPRVLDSYRGRDGMPTYVTGTGLLGVRPVRAANSIFDLTPLSVDTRPGGALDVTFPTTDPDTGDAEDEQTSPGVSDRVTTRVEPVSMHEQLIESMREVSRVSDELRITGGPPREDQAADDVDTSGRTVDELRGVDIPRAASQPVPLTPTDPDADADSDAEGDEPGDQGATPDPFRLQLDQLRERLEQNRRSDALSELLRPRDDQTDADDPDAVDPDEEEDDEDRRGTRAFIEETRELLGGAHQLESLIAKEGVEDIYGLHMKRGQELLAQERWFDAEERFSAALRARRGDVMAAAGRVSSQIGAGMTRSAALNLRNLLTAYPEMMQVTLAEGLFPGGERLQVIRRQLLYRAERGTDISRDAAFVLSYVGYQSGNADDVAQGFDLMRSIDRELAQEQGAEPQPFTELEQLVEALWSAP